MRPPKERYIAPDSFAAVIRAYLASPKFSMLARSTRDTYLRSLKIAEQPDILGAIPAEQMRPYLVQGFLDGLADRPGAQMNARVALKAVERWAIVRQLLPVSITFGTEVVGGGDGHRPWTDEQVRIAELHAAPHIARAVILAAETGQRGSDLIRMRWSDIEQVSGRMGVNVRQRKTGLQLWIPFTQHLMTEIAKWERRPTTLLLKPNGVPWKNRNELSVAWNRERDGNPSLAPCRGLVLHGLRATACVRLRHLGAQEAQISAMVGLSIPMVTRYCRFAVQKDNAIAAVHILDRTAAEHPTSNIKKVTE